MREFRGGEDLSFTPEEEEAIRQAGGVWPPRAPFPVGRGGGWRAGALVIFAVLLMLGIAGAGRKPQPAASAESARAEVAITRRAVHLRQAPSVYSPSVRVLPEGTLLAVREHRSDGFHRVWDGAREGYSASAYLAVSGGVETVAHTPARVARLTGKARLREQPSLASAPITVLESSAPVTVVGLARGWCLVWTGARAGFLWGGLIEENPALPFRPRQEAGERVVTYGERVLRP